MSNSPDNLDTSVALVPTKKQKKSRAVSGTDIFARLAKKVTIPLPSNAVEIVEYSLTGADTWMLDSAMALHFECFKKLKDKLPKHFVEDVIRRGTGNLFIARVKLDDFRSSVPSDVTVDTTHPYVVVGACLLVHMVFWSKFKDTEFMLRKIGNIFSLFVDERMRGAGIGSQLLDTAAACARAYGDDELSLEVRSTNPARSLYERKGFREQNVEEDFYDFGPTRADRRGIEMAMSTSDYPFNSNRGLSNTTEHNTTSCNNTSTDTGSNTAHTNTTSADTATSVGAVMSMSMGTGAGMGIDADEANMEHKEDNEDTASVTNTNTTTTTSVVDLSAPVTDTAAPVTGSYDITVPAAVMSMADTVTTGEDSVGSAPGERKRKLDE